MLESLMRHSELSDAIVAIGQEQAAAQPAD
jgi:hypothetical protein